MSIRTHKRWIPFLLLTSLVAIYAHLPAAAHDGHGDRPSDSETPLAAPPAGMDGAAQQTALWVSERIRQGNALMQRARESGDARLIDAARGAFAAALKRDAGSSAAMTGLAWVYGTLHEFDASVTWARKALSQDPRNADAHGLMGDAAVERGDYASAFEHYQEMLDLRPNLAAYSRGAHLLFLTGDGDGAVRLLQKAINAGAPYAENTLWCVAELAHIYWCTGQLAAAEALLDDGLLLAPENQRLWAVMGRVKASQGDLPAARSAYAKSLALRPQLTVRIAMERLRASADRHPSAADGLAWLDGGGKGPSAMDLGDDIRRVRIYADHNHRLPEALEAAVRIYARYKNIFAADTLAWCLYKNGEYERGRELIAAALRFETQDPFIWYHAGMIYWKLGAREEARSHLVRALELNPRFDPLDALAAEAVLAQVAPRLDMGKHPDAM